VLRLFLLLNLLLLSLFACKGGYDSCKQKIIDSKTIQNCSLEIPVKKHQRLIYSKTTPKVKILKHDPFLNLYLVEDKKGFKYPFEINMRQQLGYGAVNETTAYEGKIVKKQIGLNSFAHFSDSIVYPSILTSSCCSLEGIVTPEGIIEKSYLKRFVKAKEVFYSDIGIRVIDEGKYVIVSAVDPYFKENPFKKGDCIVAFNGKKVINAAQLMQNILFSKLDSLEKVKVKRSKKFLNYRVKSYKRYGGGYISDTFLEQKGIYFDKELHITKVEKNFKNYGLRTGDKLLKVNGTNVSNQAELKAYIADFKDFSSLLLERDHFQFFVQIN